MGEHKVRPYIFAQIRAVLLTLAPKKLNLTPMLQLDFHFSDPPNGPTETVSPCHFASHVPHHPRLSLAVRREWFKSGFMLARTVTAIFSRFI